MFSLIFQWQFKLLTTIFEGRIFRQYQKKQVRVQKVIKLSSEENKMGTDLDFALQLRKNKLVSMQFEQPANELDAMTEPTQQPNAEFILHLMRMLEQRFGNSIGDDNDDPVVVVIQLGDNQRIIIAFPNNQRPRVPEPLRQRPFQRLMREIIDDGNDRIEDEDLRELRRHRVREPVGEILSPQRQRIPQIPQMIPQVQYQDQDWDLNLDFPNRQPQFQQQIQRNPQESLQATISSHSLPHQEQLRHSQGVLQNVKDQQPKQKRQQQLKKKDNNNKMSEEHEVELNPESKQEFQPHIGYVNRQERNLASLQDRKNALDQTVVPLNHDLFNQVNNHRRQQQPVEEEVTCWQTFVRMISNIFRPRFS